MSSESENGRVGQSAELTGVLRESADVSGRRVLHENDPNASDHCAPHGSAPSEDVYRNVSESVHGSDYARPVK